MKKYFSLVKTYLQNNRHFWLALYVPVFLVLFFTVERLVPEDAAYWV